MAELRQKIEVAVRQAAHSIPPSDMGSTRAIRAVTDAVFGIFHPEGGGEWDREALGKEVRRVWIAWAQTQPEPKASWLVEWDGLSEPDKEVDRQIGERLFALGALSTAPPAPQEGWRPIEGAPRDGSYVLLWYPGETTDSGYTPPGKAIRGIWERDIYAKTPRPFWKPDDHRTYGLTHCRRWPPIMWQPLPTPPTPESGR